MTTTPEPERLGVFPDMPATDYHNGPGISNTDLGLLLRSPLHYTAKSQFRVTPALIVGRAFHTATLEPEKFEQEFVVWNGADRRTKQGKTEWAEFQVQHAGKDTLTPDEHDQVRRMADAVLAHPAGEALISERQFVEHSVFWKDDPTGVLCKCRPDVVSSGALVDLKSSADASVEQFKRAAWNYGYHRQAAFYREGWKNGVGEDLPFVWIVCEKEPPYAVAIYTADEAQLHLGDEEWRRAVNLYHECSVADAWPGYSERVEPLGVPRWARPD